MRLPSIPLILSVGFSLGLIFGVFVMGVFGNDAREIKNDVQQVKEFCEAELPRNQECFVKLVGVIDDIDQPQKPQ